MGLWANTCIYIYTTDDDDDDENNDLDKQSKSIK